ncbi:hypothetical protein SOASR030_01120 [Leminorella grimontii]|uniref:Sugar tyrosine-protein kinase n=1 Tax=Leminorella grimontii TaxID=82981 RepID=A0AAV5MVY3_9GAMM|nr:hypothetical protein [Leminorella grimontii]KFC95432.1 hypothetical protein GLGR_1973 [Leminorella grimontii ATCC 33999 = DSM 5078]GKX54000.1 hypothetical protein SOASR030_01120 [Leminorella grimontii]GKX60247.1 hypothetical protein SOASR031_25620 [Leminorella grimontii]VFS60348.1 Uncharacterised protein [Leminorella grimontii]
MESKKIYTTILILLFFVFFLGWWITQSAIRNDNDVRDEAKNSVSSFQELYNQGEFIRMYEYGTDNFKKITAKEDFIALMEREKEVLGKHVKSELTFSNVINSNVVILTYRSTYERYSLIEEFQFIREDEQHKLKLGTYFIDDRGTRGKVIKL